MSHQAQMSKCGRGTCEPRISQKGLETRKSTRYKVHMGFLFVTVIFALSCWELAATFRRLRRGGAGVGWWIGLTGLLLIGLAVGFWCAFDVEYHAGPNFRIGGVPLPLVFFHLEGGQWVDFRVAKFQAWAAAFANILAVAAIATLPIFLIYRRRQRRNPVT